MTQGNALAMVYYRIGIIPRIKGLKSSYPDITQSWYAKDYGVMGIFDHLEQYFNSFKRNGPTRGYYPNPTKIFLIVHPNKPQIGGVIWVVSWF